VDVPGGEEEDPLCEAVAHQVEERPNEGPLAEPEGHRQDPHVLHAGVCEHPLEVGLARHEDGGRRHGDKAHEDEGVVVEARCVRRRADLVGPHKAHEGAGDEPPGEKAPHDPRGLAVGVWLPGVERCEPHLGPVADQEEDEGGLEPGRGEEPCVGHEWLQQERRFQAGHERRVGEEEESQERQGDPHGADEHVLPGRLDGADVAVEVDEGRHGEGGRLDGDPEESQVVADGHHGHGREADRKHGAEEAVGPLPAETEVTHGVDRAGEEQEAHGEEHEPAQGVQVEPPPRGGGRGERKGVEGQGQVKRPDGREDPWPSLLRRDEPCGEGAEKGCEEESGVHPFIPSGQ
jgi:hypothetical protein